MEQDEILDEAPGLHQGERSPGHHDNTGILRGAGHTDILRLNSRHWVCGR